MAKYERLFISFCHQESPDVIDKKIREAIDVYRAGNTHITPQHLDYIEWTVCSNKDLIVKVKKQENCPFSHQSIMLTFDVQFVFQFSVEFYVD